MTAPGSIAAFEELYQSEQGRLLRYFSKRAGPDAAPDLMQETFTRVLRSGALDRIDNPQAYLSRAARNLLIDRTRQTTRRQTVVFPFDEERHASEGPEQTLRIEAADLRRIYRQALLAMPPRTRRIFLMHRLRHLTYKEIAEHLGVSNKTVKYHMTRALARCRKTITPT